mmetsp:Transcript_9001/g.20276  ORF Transcript_9001/g.20276 Transcript_9001/m.20276 type:complete len:109 (+) Transcript_9001:645-971(+)
MDHALCRNVDVQGPGEYSFDVLVIGAAIEVFALIEFWLRGKENSWWLLLVVPLALAYLAISAIKGSGLQGILGLGGGKSEAGEPDEAMEAKRRRRQELKMKRSGAARK